jgi:hypothetical protein
MCALKAPLPRIPLFVTEGVNQSMAFDFILAGASAETRHPLGGCETY